jgi:hypothetical protein
MAVSVEGLASAVRGRVVQPGASDYDEARALYNAMIDKRPAAIAYCVDEGDVAAALRYGVERGGSRSAAAATTAAASARSTTGL